MKKKLSLNTLNVNSFVTAFDAERQQTANMKGGTGSGQYSAGERICQDPNSNNTCASNCAPCGGTNNSCGNCTPTNNQACPSFGQRVCQDTNDPWVC